MAQNTSVTVRARITEAELEQLQRLAFESRRQVSELVADALRAAYPNLTEQENRT